MAVSSLGFFGIGGWAPPFLSRIDPWEVVLGIVVVIVALCALRYVAENWTERNGDDHGAAPPPSSQTGR